MINSTPMKCILFFTIVVCSTQLRAQAIISSENPVAVKYLLRHSGLKGKVKFVAMYGSNNNLMNTESYDEAGRLTKTTWESFSPTISEYIYDTIKKFVYLKQRTGAFPPLTYMYQFNDNSDIIFYLHKEGDPLRQFIYEGRLLVKDTSANRYSKDKVYHRKYTYNEKGQVTKLIAYGYNHKLEFEETYSYVGNKVFIKNKRFTTTQTSDLEISKYYDNNGSLLKEVYFTANSSNLKAEPIEYKLDAMGNWIWKTGGVTRKIEYYATSNTK